jgi:hypothetical protein
MTEVNVTFPTVLRTSEDNRTDRSRRRTLGAVMALAATAFVVLVMTAESRLTNEQRVEMFEALHTYP